MRNAERAVRVGEVPRYADLVKNGVGHYLRDPSKAGPKDVYYQ